MLHTAHAEEKMPKIRLRKPFEGEFRTTQKFGENPDFYKKFGLKGHEGWDIATPVGTPILAAHDGVVVRDKDKPTTAYGIYVCIWDDKQNCATYYAHLSKNTVELNQRVGVGEIIGYSGNTGRSTGPHLHFGLVRTDENGYRINRDNGYQGFINPLDGRIVEWVEKEPDHDCGEQKPEGEDHNYKWFVREHGVEKERADKLEEKVRELKQEIDRKDEKISDLAEEIAKKNSHIESLQKSLSECSQNQVSNTKLIQTLTQEKNRLQKLLDTLEAKSSEQLAKIEKLEAKIAKLEKKNDLDQYSTGQLVFEILRRIRGGDKDV